MENILNLLTSGLGSQIINGVTQNTNVSPPQATSVVATAIPVLLGALQKNASSPDGANGILGAINNKHDGSILNNISGFLGSGGNAKDGNGILNHIFGNQKPEVEKGISSKTGVSAANVSKILILLAPIVMGYLGRQAKNNNANSGGEINQILSNTLGGKSGNNILNTILDQNGDGKLGLDDLTGLFSNNNNTTNNSNNKENLGGLLGKIFGR